MMNGHEMKWAMWKTQENWVSGKLIVKFQNGSDNTCKSEIALLAHNKKVPGSSPIWDFLCGVYMLANKTSGMENRWLVFRIWRDVDEDLQYFCLSN